MAELVDARNYVDPVDFEKQMKYGIQITKGGNTTYACNAKGGYISETADITDIALFVQKDSAVKALRAARKYGYEPEGTTLQVVGVSLVVSEVTDVEKPPQKVGHVLVGLDKEGEEVFYGDPATKAVSRPDWVNAERATFFKSDIAASLKLKELHEYHAAEVLRLIDAHVNIKAKFDAQELRHAKNPSTYRGWDTVSSWQVKQAEEAIEREQDKLKALDDVTVEFVQ